MTKKVLSIRMPAELVDLLQQVCDAQAVNISSFVRRATKMELARLSYLSTEEKKALGVEVN